MSSPIYWRCEPSLGSRFDLTMIQLSTIQMQSDSRCMSAYGILNDLYFCTFSAFTFTLYSESPSSSQTTAVYKRKAASFQCIHIRNTKRSHLQCLSCLSSIILFSHGSFMIRHQLTVLHTPELDSKVASVSLGLG